MLIKENITNSKWIHVAGKYYICELKYKFPEDFMRKPCLQNLTCPTFYLLRSAPADTTIYCFCPRMIHGEGCSCEENFSAAYAFLGVVESVRASEASVRGRRPFTSLGHGERVILVQRATRGIFDVKVLLPRLVCSASKFQTSCLWNLTRRRFARLAKAIALARVTRASAASKPAGMRLSGNLMNEKSLLQGIWYLLAINKQLVPNAARAGRFTLWSETNKRNF